MENFAYLGQTIKNPVSIVGGRPAFVSGLDLLEQSILNILLTPVGTRPFLREFGSRIDRLVFEPNNEVLENLLWTLVKEALDNWEGRIKFLALKCTFAGADRVDCAITYNVLSSNEVRTFVFPYYRKIIY